jgi:lysophospholipase L1-like esterase
MSRRKAIGFYLLMISLSVTAALGAGELIARWLLTEESFRRVSNVYRPVDVPALGYTYKPDLRTVAFGVPLETNGLGFRGPDWTRSKTAGTRRIALIGDSYAFGFGVSFEDTMGERLARILEERTGARHEVLNFGVNGYNSRQQLALVNQVALGLDPDIVILVATNNDHEEALAADDEGWLHFDGEAENPRSRVRDKLDLGDASGLRRRSRLLSYLNLQLRFLAQRFRDRGLALRRAPDGEWMGEIAVGSIPSHLKETLHRPLKQMVLSLHARGVPVIVASACATSDYRMTLSALADELSVPLLELMTLFPEAANWHDWVVKFGLGWDDHPNAEAHMRFARALADGIEELRDQGEERAGDRGSR